MCLLATPEPERAPAGKRRVVANRWGNTNAYIAGRFWRTIGRTHAAGVDDEAAAFLRGEID